jgi:hypothetical protein
MDTEQDESPSEDEADPIDAVLANADWPKRTKDSQADIEERIAARGPRTPFITGPGGWFAWFDIESMDWDADREDAPLKMIREGFGEQKMNEYIEANKTRQELYDDVVAFLATWGVKASVVD